MKVKFKVNEELNKRIQEIVFGVGGSWGNTTKEQQKIKHIGSEFLYLDEDWCLYWGNNPLEFEDEEEYKEISPIDFIISFGEQEWLPKYKEEAEFSDDNKIWNKKKFISYIPKVMYPFMTEVGNYKYCRPITQKCSESEDIIELPKDLFDKLIEYVMNK